MFLGISISLVGRLKAGGFTPATLFANGEAGVWYDPSDISTLFQDDAGTTPVTAAGQTVGLMLDKSPNDYHATQPTAAARPTYQTDGTYHWLEFDGVDDFMETPTITPGIDKVQVFAGVRKLSDAASAILLESSAITDDNEGSLFVTAPGVAGAQSYVFRSKGTIISDAQPGRVAEAPTTNIVTGLGDISGDLATLRIDGSQADQTTTNQGTGNYLAYPIYIGARAGSSLFFEGHIYSLITRFGPNLDTSALEGTEAYLAGKTGVEM